jgi:hypothetical protein
MRTREQADPRTHIRRRQSIEYATVFPEHLETGTPEELVGKDYACSGSPDSRSYREATQFRVLTDMDWTQARTALNRLVTNIQKNYPYYDGRTVSTRELVALAEFALTAQNFDFVGKKGEAAPKFRQELAHAITVLLHAPLVRRLANWAKAARIIERPIADSMRDDWPDDNNELRAMVPTPDGAFVKLIDALPEQAFASLEYLRAMLADRGKQRPFADNVAARLTKGDVTAQEYTAAIGTADTLEFLGKKLVALYAGIMHSMPIYRLYPATSERQAIDLWWPWGRVMPLVDGGPSKAPTTRKKVLDPSIIQATRPQDVVREVMERTGINRTTAQRMTADMRAGMREKRKAKALAMLRRGKTKAEIARTFGLSPSRVSAMFKGMTLPKRRKPIDVGDDDDEPPDDTAPLGHRTQSNSR